MADENGMTEKEFNAILDRLVRGKVPEEIMGQGGLVKDLTRRLMERALEGEMTAHRDVGEDVLDHVGRRLGHALGVTGGAGSLALAGEGYPNALHR